MGAYGMHMSLTWHVGRARCSAQHARSSARLTQTTKLRAAFYASHFLSTGLTEAVAQAWFYLPSGDIVCVENVCFLLLENHRPGSVVNKLGGVSPGECGSIFCACLEGRDGLLVG